MRFFRYQNLVYMVKVFEEECLVYYSHLTEDGIVLSDVPTRTFIPSMLEETISEWLGIGYREVFGTLSIDNIFTQHTDAEIDFSKLRNQDSMWF